MKILTDKSEAMVHFADGFFRRSKLIDGMGMRRIGTIVIEVASHSQRNLVLAAVPENIFLHGFAGILSIVKTQGTARAFQILEDPFDEF